MKKLTLAIFLLLIAFKSTQAQQLLDFTIGIDYMLDYSLSAKETDDNYKTTGSSVGGFISAVSDTFYTGFIFGGMEFGIQSKDEAAGDTKFKFNIYSGGVMLNIPMPIISLQAGGLYGQISGSCDGDPCKSLYPNFEVDSGTVTQLFAKVGVRIGVFYNIYGGILSTDTGKVNIKLDSEDSPAQDVEVDLSGNSYLVGLSFGF